MATWQPQALPDSSYTSEERAIITVMWDKASADSGKLTENSCSSCSNRVSRLSSCGFVEKFPVRKLPSIPVLMKFRPKVWISKPLATPTFWWRHPQLGGWSWPATYFLFFIGWFLLFVLVSHLLLNLDMNIQSCHASTWFFDCRKDLCLAGFHPDHCWPNNLNNSGSIAIGSFQKSGFHFMNAWRETSVAVGVLLDFSGCNYMQLELSRPFAWTLLAKHRRLN